MIDNKTTVKKMRGRPCKNIEDKWKKVTLSSNKETEERIKIIRENDKKFSSSKVFRETIYKIFKELAK